MLQIAAILGVLIIGLAGFIMNQRRIQTRSEQDLIKELQATTEAPDALYVADADFDQPIHKPLGERLHYIARSFHGRISNCERQWTNGPDETLVRVTSDPAGRLTTLGVQGAPAPVGECLVKVLDEAQFPREVDGVALLTLRYVR